MLIKSNILRNNNELILIYSYFSIFMMALFFSPLISYIIGMLSLLFLSPFMKIGLVRISTVSIVFLQLLVIFGSRGYYDELDSDLDIYYHVYYLVSNNLRSGLYFFGGGIEIGWPLLYWVVGKFIIMEPIQLAILNSVISFFLIFFWLEKFVIPEVNINERGVIYFFILLFINTIMFGFLQRQALTLGFLLFALTSKNNKNLIFFVLLASLFHISSIPIGIVIYLSRKVTFNRKRILLLLSVLIVIRLAIVPILLLILSIFSFDFISHKLTGFTINGFSISTLRYLTLYICLLPFLFNEREFDNKNDKYLYNYAVFATLSIIAFVGINLFSDRIFMLALVIYGVFYYKYIYINNKIVGLLLALLYFFLFLLEKNNIIGSLALGDSFWSRYDYWGEDIFYYLKRL